MTNANHPSLHDQAEMLLAQIESASPDHEPFDINHFVHRLLAYDRKIAAIWCIEDVQGIRPDLTAEQAWEVLEEVSRKHDAEYGISWTTLECMADILFDRAPKTDEAEEA
jgi:transposase-like protein